MTKSLFPFYVRSLCEDVDTNVFSRGRGRPRKNRHDDWLLDVAGPFCVVKRYDSGNALTWASRLSNHFALDVRCSQQGGMISLTVVITEADMDVLLKRHYNKAIQLGA